MKEFLKNALKSRAFKLFLGAIAAALAAYAGTGCAGLLGGARHPALDVLECQATVLEPYVGDAAAEVARQIDGNQAFSPAQFFTALGLTPAETVALAKAYVACSNAPETPAEETLTPS